MSGRPEKNRFSGSDPRWPGNAFISGVRGISGCFRRVLSRFVVRIPPGAFRRAEGERSERPTNWGRW